MFPKNINKYVGLKFLYDLWPICTEAFRECICTKFGTCIGVAHMLQIFDDQLRGVNSVGGQIVPFPINKPIITGSQH